MQLKLSFFDFPEPIQMAWESICDEERQTVINKLSQLIAKAAVAAKNKKEKDDE